MERSDIRWQQRFENYSKACTLLSEICNYELDKTPAIIREGFIQRFEVTFELAWKTLKDYLEYLGHKVQPSQRSVIKEAFASNILSDGHAFIDIAIPFYVNKRNCYITAVKPLCDDECRRALPLNSFQWQQDFLYI
jgi:nucleotidyltransferase substrate binding protein (TIGR01987 family)